MMAATHCTQAKRNDQETVNLIIENRAKFRLNKLEYGKLVSIWNALRSSCKQIFCTCKKQNVTVECFFCKHINAHDAVAKLNSLSCAKIGTFFFGMCVLFHEHFLPSIKSSRFSLIQLLLLQTRPITITNEILGVVCRFPFVFCGSLCVGYANHHPHIHAHAHVMLMLM